MIIHSSDPLLDETSKRTSLTEGKCVRVDVRVIELGDGDLLEGYPLLLCGKRGG